MKDNNEKNIILFSEEGRKKLLDLFYKDQLSAHHDKKTADETLSGFKEELKIINASYYAKISIFLSNTLYAKLQDKHLVKPPWV